MKQTPAHDGANPDLLAIIPSGCASIVEVGCSVGALARAYRAANPSTIYVGIEVDPDYAGLARSACSQVIVGDMEDMDEPTFATLAATECWVFGDTLEHFRDPWAVLRRIRAVLPEHGSVAACIPNAQHWSLQAKLSCGAFRYEDSGLLDRTHLRWFTRTTMLEMFRDCGFTLAAGRPRIFDEPARERFLPYIRAMAAATGSDPEMAVRDALALQYVVQMVPTRPGTP